MTALAENHILSKCDCATGDSVRAAMGSRDVPDGVAVFGDGRPLPVLLRHAMRAGIQLLAAARPLRLRAGHGTASKPPYPTRTTGPSRSVPACTSEFKPNFPNPTSPLPQPFYIPLHAGIAQRTRTTPSELVSVCGQVNRGANLPRCIDAN